MNHTHNIKSFRIHDSTSKSPNDDNVTVSNSNSDRSSKTNGLNGKVTTENKIIIEKKIHGNRNTTTIQGKTRKIEVEFHVTSAPAKSDDGR